MIKKKMIRKKQKNKIKTNKNKFNKTIRDYLTKSTVIALRGDKIQNQEFKLNCESTQVSQDL